MQFEWDEAKNQENIRRHGINFAEVSAVFAGPTLDKRDQRKDYGEDRWITNGFLYGVIVTVVWTVRTNGVIRIISARRASKNERTRFIDHLAY